MNNLIFEKLEELFEELDNCDDIKEMKKLNQEIRKDSSLHELLETYKKLDKYDSKITVIKERIINNPLIKKYRNLENELYFTILDANIKLNSLVNKKGCSNESN